MKEFWIKLRDAVKVFLSRLSFRTGVIVLALCVIFYVASFAQALLPISATAKTTLWVVLYGCAKLTQYMGLAIVGIEGWSRIKAWFKRKKESPEEQET